MEASPPAAMFQHLAESLLRRVEADIAAMFQHLVESLPRRVEAVIAAMFQHLVESLPRRLEEAVFTAKWGDQLHINAHQWRLLRAERQIIMAGTE